MTDHCKTCHREIVWTRTAATGAAMPVDLHPPEGVGRNIVVRRPLGSWPVSVVVTDPAKLAQAVAEGAESGVSHFATCRQAAQHRKGR